jgi:hypothetical protein
MKRMLTVTAAVVAALAVALPANAMHSQPAKAHTITARQLAFHDAMRKLWEDHITWTRLAIVSFVGDLPDLQATEQQLLQNQTDIGNAIKPFYGRKAGDKLGGLLKQHILGAVNLLAAAKAGDQAKVAQASAAWTVNGREIADFLHSANPRQWPRTEMRTMMQEHLDQTLKEAVDHLNGCYAADTRDYEVVHAHILEMADMLSSGIIKQFPARFR